MPVTINVNNLTLCHKGSNGISTATLPDVCKTPSPGGPVPVPYPNIAMSMDLMKGTTTVKADGGMMCANYGSEFFKSTGDEPGVAGGVVSSTFIKEATWITFSFDVKLQGKAACRLTDKMFHNHQNTVNMAGVIQKTLTVGKVDAATKACKDAAKGRDKDRNKNKKSPSKKPTQQSYNNCGVESSRQVINSATDANISEDALLDSAMKSGDAGVQTTIPTTGGAGQTAQALNGAGYSDDAIKRFLSGGTHPEGRKNILKDHGVSSSLEPQTMDGIGDAVSDGRGVIVSLDAGKFYGDPNLVGQGHAVVVTGVVKDANGNITEVIVNDTGTGDCGKHYPADDFEKALRKDREMNVTKNPVWK